MGHDKAKWVGFRLRHDPRDLLEVLHIHKQGRPLAPRLFRNSSGDGNVTRPRSRSVLCAFCDDA